jgi:hypothetical protein
MSHASVVGYVYNPGITCGVLRPDDSAVCEIEDALRIAERSGDDIALSNAWQTLGVALVHRQTAAERDRGQEVLAEVSEVLRRPGYNLGELPAVNVYLARETARRGDRDEALALMRAASTICSPRDTCWRGAFQRPASWWRHHWILGLRVTWPKPRPRSSG